MMLARDASEQDFQKQVQQVAQMYGWLTFHATPHAVGTAWRTDGRGFPDLVLAHRDHGVIFAELKTERGRLSDGQKDWAAAIVGHVEYYCWRPSQLSSIMRRLRGLPWDL